jgi:hypothetical protein
MSWDAQGTAHRNMKFFLIYGHLRLKIIFLLKPLYQHCNNRGDFHFRIIRRNHDILGQFR